MQRYGFADRVVEINRAGAQIARKAVNQRADKQSGKAWVAGAVGPLGVRLEPLGKTSLSEAREAFAEQIRGLVEGGVDMLLIETVSALNEAEQAILAARSVAPSLPVLVMVTVDEDANCLDGSSAETAAARLTEWGADAIGCNCSVGPATVLTAIECMAGRHRLALDCHAQCGYAAGCGWAQHLSLLARVHGQLCPQAGEGRGAVCGRLLRHHTQSYPIHEVVSARDGCAGGGPSPR